MRSIWTIAIVNIAINGNQLKQLEELTYLGSMLINKNKQTAEININAAKHAK
jgi:hypothetical protein